MKDFSLGDILRKSFEVFVKNWKVLLGSFAVIFAINFVGSFLSSLIANQGLGLLAGLLSLVLSFVQLALSVGLIRIALGVVDSKAVKLDLVWNSVREPQLILFYFVVSILVGISVGVGFLLLVIPGIFLAVKMQFALYYLVDRGSKPIDSIKASWKATDGKFFKLLIFDVVFAVINILGGLLLAVPLLITIPVTMVAMAMLYRKVSQ